MNRSNLHHISGAFFLLLAIVACALPGQTLQPAPDTSSDMIETAVVGTAQAAAQQTEQASPSTATATLLAPTEALTSTALVSSYETSLTIREDGSRQFIDYRAGMQMVFPANWLAMRVGEPEYYQAWEKEGAQDPLLLDAITSIQYLDLNTFRVTAYDTHPQHILYENIPKINLVFIQDDKRTLTKVEIDERNRASPLTDYKFLSSELQETAAGLQTLVIQHQWQSTTLDNHPYIGFYKGVLFKVPAGTVAVDLFIPLDQKEPLELELNQIIDSISLFDPR